MSVLECFIYTTIITISFIVMIVLYGIKNKGNKNLLKKVNIQSQALILYTVSIIILSIVFILYFDYWNINLFVINELKESGIILCLILFIIGNFIRKIYMSLSEKCTTTESSLDKDDITSIFVISTLLIAIMGLFIEGKKTFSLSVIAILLGKYIWLDTKTEDLKDVFSKVVKNKTNYLFISLCIFFLLFLFIAPKLVSYEYLIASVCGIISVILLFSIVIFIYEKKNR